VWVQGVKISAENFTFQSWREEGLQSDRFPTIPDRLDPLDAPESSDLERDQELTG